MALSGSLVDNYGQAWSEMIMHEIQQKGSRLLPAVTIEDVKGEKDHFFKLGKATSYEVTGVNESVILPNETGEVRYVSPTMIEAARALNPVEAARFLSSPEPKMVESLGLELGRKQDEIIMDALGGTAGRNLNGSASNASFDTTNNQIAVNFNDLAVTSMSGDTSLHEGKIQKAIQIMQSNYAMNPGDEFFVIAPAKQLAGLRSRAHLSSNLGLFQQIPSINLPMVDRALEGYLGGHYISYEETGLSGTDEYVYVVLKNAVSFGIWRDIKFISREMDELKGSPRLMKANMIVGAVRMHEESAVRIICDPNLAYA